MQIIFCIVMIFFLEVGVIFQKIFITGKSSHSTIDVKNDWFWCFGVVMSDFWKTTI